MPILNSPVRAEIASTASMARGGCLHIRDPMETVLDFFALLYIPLCGQALLLLPRSQGLLWLGILLVATAVDQTIQFGWPEAISFILLYGAGLDFVAAFVIVMQQANEARQRSEQLLGELQDAHAQLQAYAGQAEELAIATERTRLARDLHDSVAQTLYGLTLQAEAASRKLAARQPDAAQPHLQAIQEDARQTLQETRLLIFALRPHLLQSEGLAAALKARLNAVEARSGLAIRLDLPEVEGLDSALELSLYRVAQQALNNAATHAEASELAVALAQDGESITLRISNKGRGFDPQMVPAGSAGLQGMAERARQMDGRLTINSAPGQGTKIALEAPL